MFNQRKVAQMAAHLLFRGRGRMNYLKLMDQWKLRDYTHRYCPEWTDPKGSSRPIEYVDIFKALGRSPAEAKKLAARIEQEHRIDRIFATL